MKELKADGQNVILDNDIYEFARLVAWHVSRSGYVFRIHTPRGGEPERLLLHRLICVAPEGMQVDHVNGNKLDNQRDNLRVATRSENARNRKTGANNASGFKGVHLHRKSGKWRAMIKVNGRHRHIGLYDTREAAARAYDLAATELHGEFARLNFASECA